MKLINFVHFYHVLFPITSSCNILVVMRVQTFDAVDGKQARRTNSSSPLGELFDHGNSDCNYINSILGKHASDADKLLS